MLFPDENLEVYQKEDHHFTYELFLFNSSSNISSWRCFIYQNKIFSQIGYWFEQLSWF